MKLTLELGDTGEDVDVDLPAVPRIGEQILWTVLDGATDDDGSTYDLMRRYRVRMVDWALSPRSDGPFVLVRLDLIEDVSGAPLTAEPREQS